MTTTTQRTGREQAVAAARAVLESTPPGSTPQRDFLAACFDAGLAWVHFPPGLGGLGLEQGVQADVDAILQSAGGRSRST